jgi:hypothetical protein
LRVHLELVPQQKLGDVWIGPGQQLAIAAPLRPAYIVAGVRLDHYAP